MQANHKLLVRLLDAEAYSGTDEWEFQPNQTIDIGRASSSAIQIRDGLVSKQHASLNYTENGWVCASLGRNGVFFQGERIEEIPVQDGMVLRFAPKGPRLHFQLLAAEDLADEDPVNDEQPSQEVIDWIEGLANGDPDAASAFWEEYYERVVKLARVRINERQRRISDEEDVAVSVFKSICAGLQKGKYPDLKDHDGLWRLLCVMTKRKVIRHTKHKLRQKRGGGQIRGESVFGKADTDSNAFGLESFGSDDASGFGQQLLDHTEWLFETLGDDELRRITELKLALYTNEDIADELGCHVRTVKRRLQTIRSILSSAME